MAKGIKAIILGAVLMAILTRTTFAGDCDQLPVDFNMNLEACCRFPNVSDPAAEAKIQEFMKKPEHTKMTPGDQFTLACKIATIVFNEMKVIKDKAFDKDLYYKMIDSKVQTQEDYWRQPLKEAFDQCREPITADVTKIQKAFAAEPFNIKKDECDAQFLAMFMCIHVDSFVKCPEKAWKLKGNDVNPSCASVKSWFGKCGKDIDALKRVIEKSNPSE